MPQDLRLYNTLTRKKELFTPLKPGEAGIYACGPTVYWYQHIGNLRTYVSEDILKRVLLADGYKVKHIINITDVGHLVSDADQGEDKLVKALKREGLPPTRASMLTLAEKYTEEFILDIRRLNVLEPELWSRATAHVDDMITLIRRIEANGYAYKTDVGLCFDTGRFPNYAELARLKLDDQEEGARGKKDLGRRNKSDFALWLTNQPNHVMLWDSPWGPGFPGWHIECSAMGMKYLGEQFDIHFGGKEHIPVHHTNEIAQSEAATGKRPFVNYWLHTEWLVVPGGKMSKSKGSFVRVADLVEKGIPPLAFRYFCFTAHYRSPLSFTWEALDGATRAYKGILARVADLQGKTDSRGADSAERYRKDFGEAVHNDLNVPQAVAVLNDLLRDDGLGSIEKLLLVSEFDAVLGLDLTSARKAAAPAEVIRLAEERLAARGAGDWAKSDELRAKIRALGWRVKDGKGGFELEPDA